MKMNGMNCVFREKILPDPNRPGYHFAIPEGQGMPFDPNGAFFADGVCHLMYLYYNEENAGYHWGHVSSIDLLHWRHHPDALTVEDGDQGCFSGGAFLDDDGTAYLTFWKFPSRDYKTDNGGIALAKALPPYEKWERIRPIAVESRRAGTYGDFWKAWGQLDIEHDGFVDHVAGADPGNIWKTDGWYYLQTGNKPVLDTWGRDPDSEERYRGDWTDLFRSKDLQKWEFVHRFYCNPRTDPAWPDETEDDMCPSLLPLYDAKENGKETGKWLQLFISHNRGCQYYVGSLENERFYPEKHGRMSWNDNLFFAPEALVDGRNRQIMWAWLNSRSHENYDKHGWCGVYSFPRVLWWEDGELRMAPAQELTKLQIHHQVFAGAECGLMSCLSAGDAESGGIALPVRNGQSFRLKAVFDMKNHSRCAVRVKENRAGTSYVEVAADMAEGVLSVEAVGSLPRADGKPECRREEAPFYLREGETLSLDIFVDRSIVEVYANERQAVCRYVYMPDPHDADGVRLVGSPKSVISMEAWEIAPSNPY